MLLPGTSRPGNVRLIPIFPNLDMASTISKPCLEYFGFGEMSLFGAAASLGYGRGAQIPFPKDTPHSGCRNFDSPFYRKPRRFGMGGIQALVSSSSIKFQEKPHAGAPWGARHPEIMGIMPGFWVLLAEMEYQEIFLS